MIRRVGLNTGLQASSGVNTFVIKHPKLFDKEYPNHVKSATFYGRLLSAETIINVDIQFEYDATVSELLLIAIGKSIIL